MELKFINDLYRMYRHHLTGDEEDADVIAFAVLEQFNREDLKALIDEMNEQELNDMVGIYLIEMLKGKMAQEGLVQGRDFQDDHKTIH
jgi:hypothetical protein